MPAMVRRLALLAILMLLGTGCGGSVDSQKTGTEAARADGPPQDNHTAPASLDDALYANLTQFLGDTSTPEITLEKFLHAVQSGNDETSEQLLTALARVELEKIGQRIEPPGNPSAEFKIGDVEYLGENRTGARVLSWWRDADQDGNVQTSKILWMMRNESGGWRIGGMAFELFEGEPPLLMNFEDPAEMFRKQQLAEVEMQRRAAEQPPLEARRIETDPRQIQK